ncbi:MAG: hypothetical protein HC888_00030 [Candidatus Competibacteraceae bacterium]|nr:hypothetical protein [Candidatus Competibacteraceae bacterium]
MSRIFVSIASYRDPDLNPTIRDCIEKASDPSKLSFGIAWQSDENEKLDLAADSRVQYIKIPYRDSQGACWARSLIQEKFYNGEELYFQLDSHHRFVKDWDIKLQQYLSSCSSPKPILTTYSPSFDPGNFQGIEHLSYVPWKIDYWRFVENGIIIYRPSTIDNYQQLQKPVPARFISGHMLFAKGSFVEEVPYDPNLYFTGEEMTLSVRAFTHGWDLYHPHRVVSWHEYERKYRVKHWDDHIPAKGKNWFEIDRLSKARCGELLLKQADLGRHGLGKVRTLRDYERYAGVCFSMRGVESFTAKHQYPPSPLMHLSDEEWLKSLKQPSEVEANFSRSQLPSLDSDDSYEFWFFGCHDENGDELGRIDLKPAEIESLLRQTGDQLSVYRTFETVRKPATWTIWPYSKNKKWLSKITSQAKA